MIHLRDIRQWQELRRGFRNVFRARWFWILMLIVATLGVMLGFLLPVTSSPPM